MERMQKGISGKTRILFSGELTQPDNSGYTILLDTTRKLPNANGDAPGVSASLPTVPTGGPRGQALGRSYGIMVTCTAQNVTLLQYVLAPSGAWTAAVTTTITAAAVPQAIAWDPSLYGAADVMIVVLAGATQPTHVYAQLTERLIP
jgi:hypothetical protein